MDYLQKFLHVEGVIGQGAFGRVLMTSPLQNASQNEQASQKFALKCIYPISKPQRLVSEVRHLRDLGGQCNVVQMHTAHLHRGSLYIVMELIEHDKFVDFVALLAHEEIVMYMRNLLVALQHVHARNIMHRDIKPANFLFSRKERKFLLVDFGLAQVVRTRSALFATSANLNCNGGPNSPARKQHLHGLASAPTTPSGTHHHNHIHNHHHNHHHLQAHQLAQAKPQLAPKTPTKRQLPPEVLSTNEFNLLLKKLRVSAHNDDGSQAAAATGATGAASGAGSREPVRLTVGAYESPVTDNETRMSRRNVALSAHKFSTPTVPSRRSLPAANRCGCRGKPKTCASCLAKPEPNAPKSGTPGFKAPEILLRYPNQNCAIDVWSAGVILACLLSGHTPFFRDVDDNSSLGEIITLLGSRRLAQAAKALGIRLEVVPGREPLDLRQLCQALRQSSSKKRQLDIPEAAFELLERMLDPNPNTRITATEALGHRWLQQSEPAGL